MSNCVTSKCGFGPVMGFNNACCAGVAAAKYEVDLDPSELVPTP